MPLPQTILKSSKNLNGQKVFFLFIFNIFYYKVSVQNLAFHPIFAVAAIDWKSAPSTKNKNEAKKYIESEKLEDAAEKFSNKDSTPRGKVLTRTTIRDGLSWMGGGGRAPRIIGVKMFVVRVLMNGNTD